MININLLKAEFVKNNCTQKDISKMLGISQKTLYNRLKQGKLGSDEVQTLIERLNIENPMAIFFA